MRPILLVARRELGGYFNTGLGWAVIAILLALDGLMFNAFAIGDKPRMSTEVLEGFFYFSFGTTLVTALLLTMRTFAEERQAGTAVVLDASPLTDLQLVAGKYLAAMVMLSVAVLGTLHMPALILVNGKVSVGHLLAGYVGLLAAGGAVAAIGVWASAMSRTQLAAAVLGGGVVLALVMAWLLAKISGPPLADLFSWLALFDRHYNPFRRGRIHLEDLVYFASLSATFLALAVHRLAIRRWS